MGHLSCSNKRSRSIENIDATSLYSYKSTSPNIWAPPPNTALWVHTIVVNMRLKIWILLAVRGLFESHELRSVFNVNSVPLPQTRTRNPPQAGHTISSYTAPLSLAPRTFLKCPRQHNLSAVLLCSLPVCNQLTILKVTTSPSSGAGDTTPASASGTVTGIRMRKHGNISGLWRGPLNSHLNGKWICQIPLSSRKSYKESHCCRLGGDAWDFA